MAVWLRDVLVGSVNVLIGNVLVDYYNNYKKGHNYFATTRFVALQIRRPSGRPQGILDVGFTLLDTTMKSMPLCSEVSVSTDEVQDFLDQNKKNVKKDNFKIYDDQSSISHNQSNIIKLRRAQSDRTDITLSDDSFGVKHKYHNHNFVGSMVGSSMIGSSDVNEKCGSMVNGSMCNSDVGPSASIVAAAIAKGLIKTRGANKETSPASGSSILEGLLAKRDNGEELRTKLERWRTKIPPIYDHQAPKQPFRKTNKKHKRRHTDGSGLFSCFGNAFGCEISITCGGATRRRMPTRMEKYSI